MFPSILLQHVYIQIPLLFETLFQESLTSFAWMSTPVLHGCWHNDQRLYNPKIKNNTVSNNFLFITNLFYHGDVPFGPLILILFSCVSSSMNENFTDSGTHGLTDSRTHGLTLSSNFLTMPPFTSLCLPMPLIASLWLPMAPYGSLWLPMAPYGSLWLPMDYNGSL